MLEYMQNRCDNTGKTQKRKLQEKVVRITTSSCQRLKKRKEKKKRYRKHWPANINLFAI